MEWQPIETAPNDGHPVLVTGGGAFGDGIVVREADGDWWRMRKREGSTTGPTHWAPLPDPPKD